MKVKFSPNTKDDFGNYKEYLQELKKSDSDKYYHINPGEEKKNLRNSIGNSIGNKDNHSDSIFPKEFRYGSESHKMYVDKKRHHVVFYKIINPKKGKPYISIEKCIHSTDLSKELEKKDIKPLENCDPELLLDFLTIEKEDKVNNETITDEERDEYNKRKVELEKIIDSKNKKDSNEKYDSESDEIEKEDKDENGNPRQYKTGPKGGKYYRVKIDGKWGPWNSDTNESIRNINIIIKESKMMRLVDYIKNRLVG